MKNEPLIVKFVELIEQSADIIDIILHNENLTISDKEYIELRDGLKWFRRFYELGGIELIDKSRGTFLDVRDISSSLKVHYKWLVKLLKKLFVLLDPKSNDEKTQLTNFLNRYINVLIDVDKFRKIRKRIKKLLSIPTPHFSESAMAFDEKLRSLLKKQEVTEEDLIESEKTRLKIASLGLAENFAVREQLIEICTKNYKNNRVNVNRSADLMELEELAAKVTILKESDDNRIKTVDNSTEIEMWPIYEFFFLLFTCRFQRKFSENFSSDVDREICKKFDELISVEEDGKMLYEDACLMNDKQCENVSEKNEKIYDESVFEKFERIPTIPVRLIGLLKALNSDDTLLKQKISLFPELLSSIEEFSQRSFAVKNSDVLLHWCDADGKEGEMDDDSSNLEVRLLF